MASRSVIRLPETDAIPTESSTGKQVYKDTHGYWADNTLDKRQPCGWYDKVRLMSRDPTIKLVTAAAIAPAMMTTWSVEADKSIPQDVVQFANDSFSQHRTTLIRTGLMGCTKFGWQGYEKIFGFDDQGRLIIRKFKPLLQDITDILIYPNGDFWGFLQCSNSYKSIDDVYLDTHQCLLFNYDVEGTYHYGEAAMFAAEAPYDDKILVNNSAKRYDQKIAGAHWIVHYPIGKSTIGGEVKDNYDIAMSILNDLESSGRMAVPRKLSGTVTDLNSRGGGASSSVDAWEIELITAYGSQVPFNDRMMYLDNLLVRAFGFPERAILQGQFGTKAEAGEHGTFAIVNIHLRHSGLVEQVNHHALNQLLAFNYGVGKYENKVKLTPAPLADSQQLMLKDIYSAILTDARGFAAEVTNIDMASLRDKLNIPSTTSNKTLTIEEVEPTPTEPDLTVPQTPAEFSLWVKAVHNTLFG